MYLYFLVVQLIKSWIVIRLLSNIVSFETEMTDQKREREIKERKKAK